MPQPSNTKLPASIMDEFMVLTRSPLKAVDVLRLLQRAYEAGRREQLLKGKEDGHFGERCKRAD